MIGTALICHCGHGLKSASTVHCGILAHLKTCKRCTSSLDLVGQNIFDFLLKKLCLLNILCL